MTQRWPKHGIWLIVSTLVLDSIGMGLLLPVLPELINSLSGDPSAVSSHMGYFIGCYSLAQFLFLPLLGSVSDVVGRKPILVLSLLGAAVDYLCMALTSDLTVLYIGRVISGITAASLSVAASSIFDISSHSDRAKNFGKIGAATGLGLIIGPALGGLLSFSGLRAPFFAAALLNLLNLIFIVCFLPETLAPKKRQPRWTIRNPFESIGRILLEPRLLIPVAVYFLLFFANQVHPTNWTLYTQTKFGWTQWEVVLSLTLVGITVAISQGWATGPLVTRLGESTALRIGVLFQIFTFTLFAFITKGWMAYLVMLTCSTSGIAIPTLQSIISRSVPESVQGELQGSLFSLASLTAVVGPFLFSHVFEFFTAPQTAHLFPGAAYLSAGLVASLALILCFFEPTNRRPKCTR
ncbi:MAG: MFS transporter [Deltaproteobacteria bacterium]|nr:MFS transporter [Deltaproteobacteria bacterium]